MASQLEELKKEFQIAEYKGDFDKLHSLCNQILEIDSKLTEYKQYIALSYFFHGNYESCIKEYKNYLGENSVDIDDAYILAFSHLRLKNETEAMSIMDTLDYKDSLELKLKAYHELGDYENAISIGEDLLELDSSNEDVLLIMSEIYDELDNEGMSLFYEEELCNANPNYRPLYLMRLFELERYAQIIEIFEENPTDYDNDLLHFQFNYMIGASYSYMDRYMDGLKYLYKSYDLNPLGDIKFLMGRNYFMLRDYGMACRFFRDLLRDEGCDSSSYECEINENDIIIMGYMSQSSYYLGNFADSIEFSNKVLTNDMDDMSSIHLMIAYYLENDEVHKAKKWMELLDHHCLDLDLSIFEIPRNLTYIGERGRALKIYNGLKSLLDPCCLGYLYHELAWHYKICGDEELSLKYLAAYKEWDMEDGKCMEYGDLD